MKTISLNDWSDMTGKENMSTTELPPIILNPKFIECYEEYFSNIYNDISGFLRAVTDEYEDFHEHIIVKLRDYFDVETKDVGGGSVSDRFYAWIENENKGVIGKSVNDYFFDNKINLVTFMHENMLYFTNWYFSPQMFVVLEEDISWNYLNWNEDDPLKLKM